ncbi:competence protein ComEA [Salisediminibacterium halotolerans]|nr:competence protein ComEA [Actinophytocola xinjiangensis]RPE88484.1 competence protein ComEA [Salisediminibacterium halotolerans]TWG37154.1 competence protein ComEA [Salisediminibacterium halotolerans]GEL08632.1 ComE operon protein 1 [Salisediminibacterium halotolerans]
MKMNKDWQLSLRQVAAIIAGTVLLTAAGSFLLFGGDREQAAEKDDPFDWTADNEPADNNEAENSADHEESDQQSIMVDVKGAVHQPGVYTLSPDTRVLDAVEAAGGKSDDADKGQLNLAERTFDEMVVHVPSVSDMENDPPAVSTENFSGQIKDQDGLINLNQADESELTELPGIGPAKAEAIVTYREENGSFAVTEDLTEVPGIGEKTYETLAESVSVR